MISKYFTTAVLVLCSSGLLSQSNSRRDVSILPPAYYQHLQTFSPKSARTNEELDKLKFPFDAEVAAIRLSLKPYYLEDTDLTDFNLPDPPANSSEQTRAELNYLLSLQNQRSNYDIKSSLVMAGITYSPRITKADSSYDAYRKNLFHIGRNVGSWFTPENMPLTADLMANVWQDASYFIWSMKYKYLRVRPYVLEKELEYLEETDWPAYPSGHATNSYINAYIYQKLSPENSEIFLRDAYDMAHSREILGVHFPSDSESGRILARQFVDHLFMNKKFLADFARVQQEWNEKASEKFAKPVTIEKQHLKPASGCGSTTSTTSTCAKKPQ